MPDLSTFLVDETIYNLKDSVARSTITTTGVVTTGSGSSYIATIDGLASLSKGLSLVMIPHVTSTSAMPRLNVNGFGETPMLHKVAGKTGAVSHANSIDWLTAGKPITVTFDGDYWVVDLVKMGGGDLETAVPTTKGGTGLESVSAGNFLVGNGTDPMVEKTPEEVCELIGAVSVKDGAVKSLKSIGSLTAGSNSAYSVDIAGGDDSGTINLKNSAGDTILSLVLASDGSVTIPMLRLTSDSYGEELPDPGIPGRIFFKKVPTTDDEVASE